VLCYGDALLKVASGERNLAQALHDGLVSIDRKRAPGGHLRATQDLLTGLDSLLRAGQAGAGDTSPPA
jgi:hypothetical protein